MSKKKKHKIVGRFVPLGYHIIDAFQKADVSDKAKWTYILLKKNNNPLQHGNKVILTFAEAGRWMAPATFARSLRELEEKGFIKKIYNGGLALGRDPQQSANIFEFSDDYAKRN